jgi:hypothetical protein
MSTVLWGDMMTPVWGGVLRELKVAEHGGTQKWDHLKAGWRGRRRQCKVPAGRMSEREGGRI